MGETPAEVRRDIEMTRERMSGTIEELEQKLNVKQMIADHPWPALAVAVGAGMALAGAKVDVKGAAAAAAASQGVGSKLGATIDNAVAQLLAAATGAVQTHVDGWVSQLTGAVGATNGAAPVVSPKDVPRAD